VSFFKWQFSVAYNFTTKQKLKFLKSEISKENYWLFIDV